MTHRLAWPDAGLRARRVVPQIKLTDEGRAHPMYEGKPTVFDAFTSHEDEVTHLGPGSTSLCGNAWSAVQALHCALPHGGVFWGVQYHPEYDLHELARLTSARTEKLIGYDQRQ